MEEAAADLVADEAAAEKAAVDLAAEVAVVAVAVEVHIRIVPAKEVVAIDGSHICGCHVEDSLSCFRRCLLLRCTYPHAFVVAHDPQASRWSRTNQLQRDKVEERHVVLPGYHLKHRVGHG